MKMDSDTHTPEAGRILRLRNYKMVRRARESKTFLQPWKKNFNMLRIKNKKQNKRKKEIGGQVWWYLPFVFK